MLFKRLLLAATFAGLWAVSASALSTPPSPVFVPQETPGSHLRQMALAALAPNGNEMTATPWDGYWQYVPVNSISAPVNSGAVKNGVYVYGAGVHYYYFQPPTGTSAATATAPNTCPNSPLSGSGYVTDGTSGATYTCIDRLFQTGTVQLSGGYKWQVTNAGTAPYFINTAVTGIACASGVASINITHNIPVSGANNFAAITLTGGTTTEYNGTWYVYPTDSSHLQIVNHVCSAAAASTMPTMTPAGPGNGAGNVSFVWDGGLTWARVGKQDGPAVTLDSAANTALGNRYYTNNNAPTGTYLTKATYNAPFLLSGGAPVVGSYSQIAMLGANQAPTQAAPGTCAGGGVSAISTAVAPSWNSGTGLLTVTVTPLIPYSTGATFQLNLTLNSTTNVNGSYTATVGAGNTLTIPIANPGTITNSGNSYSISLINTYNSTTITGAPLCTLSSYETVVNAQKVQLYIGAVSVVQLYVDGRRLTRDPFILASSNNGYVTLDWTNATPLAPIRQHRVRIETNGSTSLIWAGVNSYEWLAKPYRPNGGAIFWGTSLTVGVASQLYADNWVTSFSKMVGWPEFMDAGVGGTGLINPGTGTSTFGTHAPSDIAYYSTWLGGSQNIFAVVIEAGANDVGYTGYSPAVEAAAATAMINEVRALTSPNTLIIGVSSPEFQRALHPVNGTCAVTNGSTTVTLSTVSNVNTNTFPTVWTSNEALQINIGGTYYPVNLSVNATSTTLTLSNPWPLATASGVQCTASLTGTGYAEAEAALQAAWQTINTAGDPYVMYLPFFTVNDLGGPIFYGTGNQTNQDGPCSYSTESGTPSATLGTGVIGGSSNSVHPNACGYSDAAWYFWQEYLNALFAYNPQTLMYKIP